MQPGRRCSCLDTRGQASLLQRSISERDAAVGLRGHAPAVTRYFWPVPAITAGFCHDVVFPQLALGSRIILPQPHTPPFLAYFKIL